MIKPVGILLALMIGGAFTAGASASTVASDSDGAPVVTLRGRTTITATRTGSLLVHLERKVDFSEGFRFDVTGDGRVYGLMLWKRGGHPFDFEGKVPSVAVLVPGLCDAKGCKAEKDVVQWGFTSGIGRNLPAGDYELVVVADGAPVTVTLGVESLPGTRRAEVTPMPAEIRTLQPTVDEEQDSGRFLSAGSFSRFEDPDIGFLGLWARGSNTVATGYGSCNYSDADGPAAQLPMGTAFLPGCPTGDGYEDVNQGPNGGTVFTAIDFGGPSGIGGWFATPDEIPDHGAVALWVDVPGL